MEHALHFSTNFGVVVIKVAACAADFSTRIKDAGIAIRHSWGYIISILQGPETDLRERNRWIDRQKTENPSKKKLFSYRKMFWGRQTGWKTRAGSAGIDNSAHWSCKRWVTAKVVQNWPIWIENHKNEGFKILDSGIPKFSRRRPMPAFSLLLIFKQ